MKALVGTFNQEKVLVASSAISVIVKSSCNLGKPWFEALGCSAEVPWGRVGGALQQAGGGAPGGGPPLPPGQHQPRPGAQLPAEVESSLRLGVEAVALGNILHHIDLI